MRTSDLKLLCVLSEHVTRENKGTLQVKPGMMLDNRSAELFLVKTI